MSKKPTNLRSSKERIQKTRIGRDFNEMLKAPHGRLKLDSRPIGLREIYDLTKNHKHVVHARAFSCDIIEARVVGGATAQGGAPTILCGINMAEETTSNKTYTASPNGLGRWDSLRLLRNGTVELGFLGWASSPITFRESFLRSEQAKHLRDHVAVLITSEHKDVVTSTLYYRALHEVFKDCHYHWEPIWLKYLIHGRNPRLTHKDATVLIDELGNDHCIHKFDVYCYMGWKPLTQVVERCIFCHEERTRKPTKAEQTVNTLRLKQCDKLHTVYHTVYKRLDGLDGFDAIEEAEKIANKYKGHVQYVGCDDDVHASSALLLVDHESNDKYMGTSVIYLPQCEGTRATFFLYPGDRDELMTALEVVRLKAAAHGKKSE